jgi:pimeloyl-ACP methyl ester carboxylesterase
MSFLRFAFACAAGASLSLGCGSSATTPAPDGGTDAAPADASIAPPDAQGGDGATAGGCLDALGPGDHVYTCDGLRYDVRVPKSCATGCGMVLDVHGATMNAKMEDANTNMRAIGEREGYVVVQPNAAGTPPNALWNPPVDYPKVWAFVEAATKAFATDPKRLHMLGFSQGGRMTFTFACQHSDRIASAAPAGEIGCTQQELAAMPRKLPLFQMHGTQDALVSFTTFAVPQRDAIIAAWGLGSPVSVSSDAQHQWTRYTNGSGATFEFLQHDYVCPPLVLRGHCYPGSTDPGTEPGQVFSFACTGPNAFTWGEAAMKLFQAHPMP